jgi:hypothetical protein
MTKKVYRTAMGKVVDLGVLQLQNESVRAVGNMKVNARGDMLDHNNQSMVTRAQTVGRAYNRQVTNVSEAPVAQSRRHALAEADAVTNEVEELVEEELVGEEESSPVAVNEPTKLPEGGLAAAIAKARQIKQEPLKSPRQQAQDTPGVRKI